jgi:tRNA(Arg) A34 adenosine deaminase TadA
MIRIDLPDWVGDVAEIGRLYPAPRERMQLAIELARNNVLRDQGGPFGAAIFESDSGRLVGVGVNRVVPLNNSVLHAEIVAFMEAEARLQSFTLARADLPAHELVTSCEPCAMCLGAALWAGIRHIVWAATRQDAGRLRFDEGPVFPQSYAYLQARGVTIESEFLRADAAAVLDLYHTRQGPIYNG